MPSAKDQHMIQTVAPQCADQALLSLLKTPEAKEILEFLRHSEF